MQFYSRNITNLSLSTDVYRPIMYWNMPFPVLIGFHTQIHYTAQHRKKEKCGVVLKEKYTKDLNKSLQQQKYPQAVYLTDLHIPRHRFHVPLHPPAPLIHPLHPPASLIHPLHPLSRWCILCTACVVDTSVGSPFFESLMHPLHPHFLHRWYTLCTPWLSIFSSSISCSPIEKVCRGRDPMVVGITTTYAISAYHH